MLDTKQINQLMKLRGISSDSELASLAGIDRHTVSRLLNRCDPGGSRWETVAKLASALRVSIDDLDLSQRFSRRWRTFSWRDKAALDELYWQMESVRDCLICTQGMETYLQSASLHHWTVSQAHLAIGWRQEQIDQAIRLVKRNVQAGDRPVRLEGRSIHWTIARASWFHRSFLNEPEWFRDCRTALAELDGRTVLGLVPDPVWADVDREVIKAIRRCIGRYRRWDKLCVGDTTFALFRPSLDEFQITFHRPTVQYLRGVLETIAASFVPYEFPLDLRRHRISQSVGYCVSALDELARKASHTEEKRAKELARDQGYWRKLALGSHL